MKPAQEALSGLADFLDRVADDYGGADHVALVPCNKLKEVASALRDWPPDGAVFCRDCGAYVGVGPVQTTEGPLPLDDQCPTCRLVEKRQQWTAK